MVKVIEMKIKNVIIDEIVRDAAGTEQVVSQWPKPQCPVGFFMVDLIFKSCCSTLQRTHYVPRLKKFTSLSKVNLTVLSQCPRLLSREY